MEIPLLVGSTLCFLVAFAMAYRALRHGHRAKPWIRFGLMGTGFAMQSVLLYLRGQLHGRCPLTNEFEILVFVSWSIVLLYFVVGPAFRLSLLGFFSIPLTAVFQIIALALPKKAVASPRPPDYWLELHAAISLVAYGAFALAFAAGVMFLIQDRYLKSGRLGLFFYQLPPIHYLAQAIGRLLWLGLILFSIGIISALMMDQMPPVSKLVAIGLVWFAYAVVLALKTLSRMGSRKLASAAVVTFAFPILTYWFL